MFCKRVERTTNNLMSHFTMFYIVLNLENDRQQMQDDDKKRTNFLLTEQIVIVDL